MIGMLPLLLLVAIVGSDALASDATVAQSTYKLRVSETMPGNLLPSFKFMLSQVEGGSTAVPLGGGTLAKSPFVPDDECADEIWDHASADLHAPQLPHLAQDQWTCEREEKSVQSVVMEDEHLRATITPSWGGRIWSLWDKDRQREVVFANPAHQPANIAVLKAWSSGGIEYNFSPGIIGHSVFSESPVWMGTLQTERGEVLRTYEYDRFNASVWQVDHWMHNGTLWLHPRVVPTRKAGGEGGCLQGYWWTCVAYPAEPDTRVLAPAEWTAQTSAGRMRPADCKAQVSSPPRHRQI